MTTVDSHGRITLDDTSFLVVGITSAVMWISCSRRVGIILVRTTTTAIDIATELISSSTVDAGICNTHHTAMNSYRGIMEGMAVLTTAIDRTLDLRFWSSSTMSFSACTDDDLRIINPC